MVLPEGSCSRRGTSVPLLAVLFGVVALLWSLEPPVTDRTVLAFAPWMMVGATLHVFYRREMYPDVVAVLFATPSVYLVTATVAGLLWIVGLFLQAGGGGRLPTGSWAESARGLRRGRVGTRRDERRDRNVSAALAHRHRRPHGRRHRADVVRTEHLVYRRRRGHGATGALVVFGHTLDGISTAVGYDSRRQRVPASRLILEAGALPTAEYIGAGWLFVLVKVALAAVILGCSGSTSKSSRNGHDSSSRSSRRSVSGRASTTSYCSWSADADCCTDGPANPQTGRGFGGTDVQ